MMSSRDIFSDDDFATPRSTSSSTDIEVVPRTIAVKSCEPVLDENENLVVKLQPQPQDDRLEYENLQGTTTTKSSPEYSRFVIVSWKIRQYSMLSKSVRPNVLLHQYKSDATPASILSDVKELLKGQRVLSLAFVCHGNPGTMTLSHDIHVTGHSVESDEAIKRFFFDLVDSTMDISNPNSHFDLLASSLIATNSGQNVIQSLQEYLKIPIFVSKDILGTDITKQELGSIGELYFNASLLRTWSGTSSQSISNYEKIRTLGRGAYGTAVLYRKKDDDSLVVLKEISILDLSAAERQASMNEVRVLGMLSHPNIISYYDSFDEDGTLWIEMEYADGGTLSDYLAKQENDLEERDILILFSQMVSAIRYIHDRNILHRDLKTQNIFLTQEQKVKLGDFGIAKVMTTHNAGNFTVVGTPYYISPEMCEGKPYDSKSDIWALGCILHEMANLTKTFDGTNLPALITKIVKGTFAPIKEIYSPEFRLMVRDLLQKDPNLRPTAEEILFQRLPELLQPYQMDDASNTQEHIITGRTRSLLYYCDVNTMHLYPIQELPQKIQVAEVAVGLGHIVIVSVERGVFSWGDNSYGQLGHGDYEAREHPTEIVILRGKSIVRAICSDYSTTFLSDNGLVLTCGQGEFGALGHGDWNSITRPKLVDALLTLDISSLEAGSHHIAITTAEGEAYTWGRGDDGRLGHGSDEHLCVPSKVKFDTLNVFIRGVQCSADGTMFIADTGTAFACGRNDGNKLGINPRQGFLLQFRSRSNRTIESARVPTLNKDLCKHEVAAIKFGGQHSCLINDQGHLFSSGVNTDGQLGCGSTKPRDVITQTKLFENGRIMLVACGSTFSFAGVQETGKDGKSTINCVYFWGTRPQSRRNRTLSSGSRSARGRKFSTVDEDIIEDPYNNSSSSETRIPSGYETSRKTSRIDSGRYSSGETSVGESELDESRRTFLRNVMKGTNSHTLNMVHKDSNAVTVPQVVFKFQSIGGIEGFDEEEEFPVDLHDIKCFQDHVIIHLETTAPPPKRKKIEAQKSLDSSSLSSSRSVVTSFRGSSENSNSEMDMSGEIPTWIRNELEDGIPVFSENNNSNPSSPTKHTPRSGYIDSGNVTDDTSSSPPVQTPSKRPPLQFARTKSYDTLSRRGSMNTMQGRDPNFNIIPKLQKHQPLKKVDEDDDVKSETRIIDGVAVTVSTSQINTVASPLSERREKVALPLPIGSVSPEVARKHKSSSADTKKRQNKHPEGEITARSSSAVEYTPVELIKLEETSLKLQEEIEKTKTEDTGQHPKSSFSKARTKRTAKQRDKAAVVTNKKEKKKQMTSASPYEAAKKDANNNHMDKGLLDEFHRQAKISEEKLRQEIEVLQEDRAKQEEELRRAYEKELQDKEEWNDKKNIEAKEREQALKEEIQDLKSDLNNQNSKLQDNYNILLSLQEQLLLMQKAQVQQNASQLVKSSSSPEDKRDPRKSSVCSVM